MYSVRDGADACWSPTPINLTLVWFVLMSLACGVGDAPNTVMRRPCNHPASFFLRCAGRSFRSVMFCQSPSICVAGRPCRATGNAECGRPLQVVQPSEIRLCNARISMCDAWVMITRITGSQRTANSFIQLAAGAREFLTAILAPSVTDPVGNNRHHNHPDISREPAYDINLHVLGSCAQYQRVTFAGEAVNALPRLSIDWAFMFMRCKFLH